MSGTLSPKPKKARKQKREEKAFVRMTAEELAIVQENARKYCKGNVSKWMRERATSPMLDISIRMQDDRDAEQDAS
jgi:hypothetical protein